MVVRLHNIDKWRVWQPGKVLPLPGDALRVVRFTVNTPVPTRIDLADNQAGSVTLLGVVFGCETFEFACGKDCTLVMSGDEEVYFYTDEGESISFETVEPSFTKISTRRERNPELERVLMIQQQNFDRRMAKQADEIAALNDYLARKEAAEEAARLAAEEAAKHGTDTAGNNAPSGAGEGAPGGASSPEGEGAVTGG